MSQRKRFQLRPSVSSMTMSNEDMLNSIDTFEKAVPELTSRRISPALRNIVSNWLDVITGVTGKT